MDIPTEIFQLILDRVDFLTQIRLRQVDKRSHAKLVVHDFYAIDPKYLFLLTDKILLGHRHITKLYVGCNKSITKISHMTILTKLYAVYDCVIDDIQIANLNLTELYATGNPKITNVNHMIKLEILYADALSGIGDVGIANLNLTILNASYNPKITRVTHMHKLKILYARGFECGLSDAGITNLKLDQVQLYSGSNPKITDGIDKNIFFRKPTQCRICFSIDFTSVEVAPKSIDEAPFFMVICKQCANTIKI